MGHCCGFHDSWVLCLAIYGNVKKEKEEALAQVKQLGYDIGVKVTEDALRAQVTGVCWGYCLQAMLHGHGHGHDTDTDTGIRQFLKNKDTTRQGHGG